MNAMVLGHVEPPPSHRRIYRCCKMLFCCCAFIFTLDISLTETCRGIAVPDGGNDKAQHMTIAYGRWLCELHHTSLRRKK